MTMDTSQHSVNHSQHSLRLNSQQSLNISKHSFGSLSDSRPPVDHVYAMKKLPITPIDMNEAEDMQTKLSDASIGSQLDDSSHDLIAEVPSSPVGTYEADGDCNASHKTTALDLMRRSSIGQSRNSLNNSSSTTRSVSDASSTCQLQLDSSSREPRKRRNLLEQTRAQSRSWSNLKNEAMKNSNSWHSADRGYQTDVSRSAMSDRARQILSNLSSTDASSYHSGYTDSHQNARLTVFRKEGPDLSAHSRATRGTEPTQASGSIGSEILADNSKDLFPLFRNHLRADPSARSSFRKTPVQLHEEVTEPHHIDFESESGDSSHFRSNNFSSPKYGASILVSNQTSKRRSSKIQFSTVEVRQYERVLGDNPGVSSGPPVSIGWKHFEDRTMVLPIDEYEYYHGACTEDQCEMILTRFERETMLLELGYTEKELVKSIRENYKVKNKRRQTVNNIPLMEIEESLEKAKRSVKKVIARKKSSKHLYEDWKDRELSVGRQPSLRRRSSILKNSTSHGTLAQDDSLSHVDERSS